MVVFHKALIIRKAAYLFHCQYWASIQASLYINLKVVSSGYDCAVRPSPELKEAVEDVLPSLTEQGVTVLLMTKHCDTPGIESFSDKVDEASDSPLPRSLRSHITFKSPAVYIYTSGTTGTVVFFVCVCDNLDLQEHITVSEVCAVCVLLYFRSP